MYRPTFAIQQLIKQKPQIKHPTYQNLKKVKGKRQRLDLSSKHDKQKTKKKYSL